MMPADEISEWILQSGLQDSTKGRDKDLLLAASKTWPKVVPYALKDLPREWSTAEKTSFAMELWAKVLRSVAKTLHRSNSSRERIIDLEPYLIGVFKHRIRRFLVRERKRRKIVSFVSPEELAACEYSSTTHSHASPEREIQIKEIVDCMDEWMKEVWSARMYGYSWADIGAMVQLTEQQAKMRFRYALAKIRTQLIGGGKAGGTASPGHVD
jgi:DNA-directed RNA polymerase specialized sigma24 family protein